MFRHDPLLAGLSRVGRWCSAAALLACLGLAGCQSLEWSDLDLSGVQGIHVPPGAEWCQQGRQPDRQTDFFGVSNKAREIERHVGVR